MASGAGTDWATYSRETPGVSAFALEDSVVYHTYPRTRAGWTVSGACTRGSTARDAGATRPASGDAAMTSTRTAATAGRGDRDTRARRRIQGRSGPADERDGHGRCDPTRLVRALWVPMMAAIPPHLSLPLFNARY
jgi:hypothetical protein